MVSSLIFQKFSGEGLTEPLPRPLPPFFFSDFALGLGFALNSRALRALDSGFTLDSRGASRPRFGLRPQLSIWNHGLAPPK